MKQYLQLKLSDLATWLGNWCKANIDFALILAVCTETPRWVVVFLAIHEPLWIGVSLGVLLAFATSKVWRFYFATRSKITLAFNILAIILAVAVISPVLFAMIEKTPEQVNVSEVLQSEQLRWFWSIALALTTFVPLVQLAAVHGAETKPAQVSDGIAITNDIALNELRCMIAALHSQPMQLTDDTQITETFSEVAEDAQPAISQDADNAQPESDNAPPLQSRIDMLRSEGLDDKTIAMQLSDASGYALSKALNVDASTISRWRKSAQRNGHSKEAA